jgi:hypothetical protein
VRALVLSGGRHCEWRPRCGSSARHRDDRPPCSASAHVCVRVRIDSHIAVASRRSQSSRVLLRLGPGCWRTGGGCGAQGVASQLDARADERAVWRAWGAIVWSPGRRGDAMMFCGYRACGRARREWPRQNGPAAWRARRRVWERGRPARLSRCVCCCMCICMRKVIVRCLRSAVPSLLDSDFFTAGASDASLIGHGSR